MNRKITMTTIGILATAGLTFGGALAAQATQPTYHAAIWEASLNLSPKFPQALVHDELTASTDVHQLDGYATKCGTTYQFDLYADDATTDALVASGVLNGGGESWVGGSYRGEYSNVFTTADCAVVAPPVVPEKPAAVVTVLDDHTTRDCSGDSKDGFATHVVVTQTTDWVLDADANVWVAGKPVSDTALTTTDIHDCTITAVTPPVKPTPPTEPTTPVTDAPTPKPTTPATPAVKPTPAVATKHAAAKPTALAAEPTAHDTTQLAHTGSNDTAGLLAGALFVLLGVAIVAWRRFLSKSTTKETHNA